MGMMDEMKGEAEDLKAKGEEVVDKAKDELPVPGDGTDGGPSLIDKAKAKLDADGDGDVDLADVKDTAAGLATSAKEAAGGLFDKAKGLLKKD